MKLKTIIENSATQKDIRSRFYHCINSGTPDPSLEPSILQNPTWSVMYAEKVIKDRWPEAEPRIKKHALWAYEYARNVIKGRWLEAEPHIMETPDLAFKYAKDIIKGRWPEAEEYIKDDVNKYNQYLRDFPEARKPNKNFPLMMDGFIITDIPNTITDEQLIKLFSLIHPSFDPAQIKSAIWKHRKYDERLISAANKMWNIRLTLKDIQRKNIHFYNCIGLHFSETDFD